MALGLSKPPAPQLCLAHMNGQIEFFHRSWSDLWFANSALLRSLQLAIAGSTVLAADPWIGQKVFCKPDAKAKVGNQLVKIELLTFPSEVEAVSGDWLWLGRAWSP